MSGVVPKQKIWRTVVSETCLSLSYLVFVKLFTYFLYLCKWVRIDVC